MENEIFLALIAKRIEEKLNGITLEAGKTGPRGLRGPSGSDGRNFNLKEHEDTIKAWVKSFVPKFEDFTHEQVEALKGPAGKDGDSFNFEENKSKIEFICSEAVRNFSDTLKLKFSDLTSDEIESLRGPRGKDGRDGKSFNFEETKSRIKDICKEVVDEFSESLKLKFSDLTTDEISEIRGPKGRDGKDGKDGKNFNFEDHRIFFENLKPKFSDFTEEEKSELKLKFKDLSKDERESLKLNFKDLTPEEINSIRGERGPRGQRGAQGEQGIQGISGKDGAPGARGIPGAIGPQGFTGLNGLDGEDGKDAPYIVDIEIENLANNQIQMVFMFSDGSSITSNPVKLPAANNYYSGGGGSAGLGPISSFNLTDNQAVAAAIDGMYATSPEQRAAIFEYTINLLTDANNEYVQTGKITITYMPDTDTWRIFNTYEFDDVGVVFSVDGGQVKYTSTDNSGVSTFKIYWRKRAL